MANISLWSTTAASNNSSPPDGAPEGMAPSAVNNCIRENMAAIRTWYEDAEWINLGHTPVYVAATQFKFAGVDYSSTYAVDRRVKLVAPTPGTIYGTITTVAYSTDTTVTVSWDSGSLSNETLTSVSVGILTPTSKSYILIDDDVTTAKIADNAVTTAKINDNAVTTSKISDTLINGLSAIINLEDTDQFATADNSDSDNNKKITWANIKAEIALEMGASQSDQETGTSSAKLVTPSVQHYHDSACKAWVNFNGTGTVAIRDSYNVASITDNSTGNYTINFTTAMADGNYAIWGLGNNNFSTAPLITISGTPSTSSYTLQTVNSSGTNGDFSYVCTGVFGSIS